MDNQKERIELLRNALIAIINLGAGNPNKPFIQEFDRMAIALAKEAIATAIAKEAIEKDNQA